MAAPKKSTVQSVAVVLLDDVDGLAHVTLKRYRIYSTLFGDSRMRHVTREITCSSIIACVIHPASPTNCLNNEITAHKDGIKARRASSIDSDVRRWELRERRGVLEDAWLTVVRMKGSSYRVCVSMKEERSQDLHGSTESAS